MLFLLIDHNDIAESILDHKVDKVHCDIELNIDDDPQSDHMGEFDRRIFHKRVTKPCKEIFTLSKRFSPIQILPDQYKMFAVDYLRYSFHKHMFCKSPVIEHNLNKAHHDTFSYIDDDDRKVIFHKHHHR